MCARHKNGISDNEAIFRDLRRVFFSGRAHHSTGAIKWDQPKVRHKVDEEEASLDSFFFFLLFFEQYYVALCDKRSKKKAEGPESKAGGLSGNQRDVRLFYRLCFPLLERRTNFFPILRR